MVLLLGKILKVVHEQRHLQKATSQFSEAAQVNQEKEKPGPKPKSPYSKFDAPSTTLVLLKLSKVHSPFQELVKILQTGKAPSRSVEGPENLHF